METAVEITGLSRTYGAVRALSDINLNITAGGMVSIVGPDGAGKTTLIKIMTGILQPDTGAVSIFGFDTVKKYNEVKKRIGYLSQNFTLYGDLSIDENLEFFAEIHRVPDYKKLRDRLLSFTRLTPFRGRLAERLSGGMKQKLALACTLIHSPRVIFLDEPTTGVDPVSRREFWIILADLIRSGITVIMTTPYMDEAERSDLVGLIYQGRLLFIDTPAALRPHFRGDIIEVVTQDVRLAEPVLRRLAGVEDVELFGDRLHVQTAKGKNGTTALQAALKASGINVASIRQKTPSLENIFISLIRSEGHLEKVSASRKKPSRRKKRMGHAK